MKKHGLDIKTNIDGDITPGSVEFIDTGSTGRNTNIPYDGDFDFYMRLDADIIRNRSKFSEFKNGIKELFDKYNPTESVSTDKGDLRFKGVQLDENTNVDIDISFGVKTNKVQYSSDECLKDRLRTIYNLYPDKYKLVVANIIYAKQFFKSIESYKPSRTKPEEGGMGGVGVENWILQNGGSFITACKSFVAAANITDEEYNLLCDEETTMDKIAPLFERFKANYEVWDFGANHFAARDESNNDNYDIPSDYLYDNFISKNMNTSGFRKMIVAMKKYLKDMDLSQEENKTM